jgi:hypothetical protein
MQKSPSSDRTSRETFIERGHRYLRAALHLWSRLDPFSNSHAAKVSAIYTGWSLLFTAIFIKDINLAERISEMLDILITHFPQISPMRHRREMIGLSGLWFRMKTSEDADDRGILYGYGDHPVTGEPVSLPFVIKGVDGSMVIENRANESWTWPTGRKGYQLGSQLMP